MLTIVAISMAMYTSEVMSLELSNKMACSKGKQPFVAPTSVVAFEPSVIACALSCARNNNCRSFNFLDGRCFINNVVAWHPGVICATNFISKEKMYCKSEENFIAKGGIAVKVLSCVCSHSPTDYTLWQDYPETNLTGPQTDVCMDKCTSTTQCQTYYGSTTALPCRVCKSPPCPVELNTAIAYRAICSVL